MFNKFEIVGAGVSVAFMALALYLTQANNVLSGINNNGQAAQVAAVQQSGIVVAGSIDSNEQERREAYLSAVDSRGNVNRMIVDDIKIGVGEDVKEGDVVAVHYVGTLQNGQEFDNSMKRGQAFEFKVGAGMVIEGWEKGVVGMKVGGQRSLVIPPQMAYGERGIGPIPGNATLIFMIELLEIK